MNKTRHSAFPLALVSCAALALAGCGMYHNPTAMGTAPAVAVTSQTTSMAAGPSAMQLSAADLQFVAVAAGAGMYEVEAGRVAASRASDTHVRAYAQMLVDHHTANNRELMSLVRAKGHSLAPGLPPSLQQKVSTLSGLSGQALDREFVRTTGVQDHRAAINAFEQGRRSVTDRDLQAYIDKTLPVLRQHLRDAETLAGTLAG